MKIGLSRWKKRTLNQNQLHVFLGDIWFQFEKCLEPWTTTVPLFLFHPGFGHFSKYVFFISSETTFNDSHAQNENSVESYYIATVFSCFFLLMVRAYIKTSFAQHLLVSQPCLRFSLWLSILYSAARCLVHLGKVVSSSIQQILATTEPTHLNSFVCTRSTQKMKN